MTRFPPAPACLLLAALTALPAAATAKTLGQNGSWSVTTGTDAGGNAYCSLQNQVQDQSHGLILLIYPLGGDPSFEIHAYKNGWSMAANTDVPTSFNFSDGNNWNADGQAAEAGSGQVDYNIDVSDMQDFLTDFGQSDSLDVTFTNGQPGWTEDLKGSAQASLDLLKCAAKLLDQNAPQPSPATPPADDGAGGAINL